MASFLHLCTIVGQYSRKLTYRSSLKVALHNIQHELTCLYRHLYSGCKAKISRNNILFFKSPALGNICRIFLVSIGVVSTIEKVPRCIVSSHFVARRTFPWFIITQKPLAFLLLVYRLKFVPPTCFLFAYRRVYR